MQTDVQQANSLMGTRMQQAFSVRDTLCSMQFSLRDSMLIQTPYGNMHATSNTPCGYDNMQEAGMWEPGRLLTLFSLLLGRRVKRDDGAGLVCHCLLTWTQRETLGCTTCGYIHWTDYGLVQTGLKYSSFSHITQKNLSMTITEVDVASSQYAARQVRWSSQSYQVHSLASILNSTCNNSLLMQCTVCLNCARC